MFVDAGPDQSVLRTNPLRPYGSTDEMVVLPGRDQALVRCECGQGRMHRRWIDFTVHQGREVLSLLFTHRFSFFLPAPQPFFGENKVLCRNRNRDSDLDFDSNPD